MNFFYLSPISRRQFLGSISVAGATLGMGLPVLARAESGKRIPVGLELYSVRKECAADLPGTLSAVAKIGYKGVEFAGYHGRKAGELKKMLDDNGLVACGTHTAHETVLGDKLKETVEFNKTIGNNFLIVPSMSASSSKGWVDRAKEFNEIAAKIKGHGMFVGYHSHAHDFTQKFEDKTAWDIFGSNTNAEVILQLDTGNCTDGGGDVIAELKKFPGRTRSIHIKPHGAGPEAVIGEDKLDWKEIFGICETTGGTGWYVVEHESSKDPIDAVRRSFAALQKMGKV